MGSFTGADPGFLKRGFKCGKRGFVLLIMSPLRRGGGHIVFGVDFIGVGVGVGVAFCLHDIS